MEKISSIYFSKKKISTDFIPFLWKTVSLNISNLSQCQDIFIFLKIGNDSFSFFSIFFVWSILFFFLNRLFAVILSFSHFLPWNGLCVCIFRWPTSHFHYLKNFFSFFQRLYFAPKKVRENIRTFLDFSLQVYRSEHDAELSFINSGTANGLLTKLPLGPAVSEEYRPIEIRRCWNSSSDSSVSVLRVFKCT